MYVGGTKAFNKVCFIRIYFVEYSCPEQLYTTVCSSHVKTSRSSLKLETLFRIPQPSLAEYRRERFYTWCSSRSKMVVIVST